MKIEITIVIDTDKSNIEVISDTKMPKGYIIKLLENTIEAYKRKCEDK